MTTTSRADSQLRACGQAASGCRSRFVAEHQRARTSRSFRRFEPAAAARDDAFVVDRVQAGRDAALVEDAAGRPGRPDRRASRPAAGLRLGPDRDLGPSWSWRLMPTPARYSPRESNATSACPPNGRSQPGSRGEAVSTHTPASGSRPVPRSSGTRPARRCARPCRGRRAAARGCAIAGRRGGSRASRRPPAARPRRCGRPGRRCRSAAAAAVPAGLGVAGAGHQRGSSTAGAPGPAGQVPPQERRHPGGGVGGGGRRAWSLLRPGARWVGVGGQKGRTRPDGVRRSIERRPAAGGTGGGSAPGSSRGSFRRCRPPRGCCGRHDRTLGSGSLAARTGDTTRVSARADAATQPANVAAVAA